MAKIAVYFPGIGYHCDKPLLYYSRGIADKLGYDNCRKITYTYQTGNIRGNIEKMKETYEILSAQTEEFLADIDWNEFDDILFISKSIGTIIAASYAEIHKLTTAKHILYTPLAQTFLSAPEHAIGFIGTADPWSDTNEIIQLSKDHHIPIFVYDGCNHSLECSDILKNIEIINDVMKKTLDFCAENS